MKKNSLFAFAALLALAGMAAPVCAQNQDEVRTTAPIKLKTPKVKMQKLKAEVFTFTVNFITVRSPDNPRTLKTFTYAPDVQQKMLKIVNEGGYQYGDKVEIRFAAGSTVATKIKGKPSKPRRR